MAHTAALILGCILGLCSAFVEYQDQIPNGRSVVNPCTGGGLWAGVGHVSPSGAGVRNKFGQDWAAATYDWSKICRLDSDGDGVSNGAELGDPNCQWTKGKQPQSGPRSNPAVCEPVNSPKCKGLNQVFTIC